MMRVIRGKSGDHKGSDSFSMGDAVVEIDRGKGETESYRGYEREESPETHS